MIDVSVQFFLIIKMSDKDQIGGAADGAVHFRVGDRGDHLLKPFIAVYEQFYIFFLASAARGVEKLPHYYMIEHYNSP